MLDSKEELLEELHRLMDLADAMRTFYGLLSFVLLGLFILLSTVSWWFFLLGLIVANVVQWMHSRHDKKIWAEIKRLNEQRMKSCLDEYGTQDNDG